MAKEYSRSQRVASQIQRELAQLIQFEVKDPRVGLVTVSGVDVSRDYSYAKVYVTVMDDDCDVNEMVKALNNAAGFLRRELRKSLTMRSVPQLQFLYDASVQHGANLSALIDAAIASSNESK